VQAGELIQTRLDELAAARADEERQAKYQQLIDNSDLSDDVNQELVA
jgi:hypothetical protein